MTFAGSAPSSRAMKAAAALLDEWNRRRRAGSGRRSIAAAVVRSRRRYCSHHPKPIIIRASPSGATFPPLRTLGRTPLSQRRSAERVRVGSSRGGDGGRDGWTVVESDTNGTSPTVPHQEHDGALASGAKAFSKAVGERATRRYRL
ncbi:unnamed protein product [Lasius platythorax]|uniref:Uncharacterized protein n=1 Tax=Lasius platythorax TaxID=488582 RepID=A0AAV2P0N0_9HYME